ncbi:hypothetical protein [Amycolatopsis sp. TNS106]|uniref:hypothetical protein n=1 Tax=Amycolatopsis sp. TNS106 TaxID=2861750 RepID=UPI001C56ACCB|nr:hypothetical protein [Amycolatopsis sp. TNS106]QXV57410.1 hypothetical protein CVV72_10675 [Amycolatopsis sp. TNS106]
MTEAPSEFTFTTTDDQRRIIRNALFDKAAETQHYISGYQDVNAAPGPLDTCCDRHMARFRERKAERDSLLARLRQVRALIEVVDSAVPATTADVLTSPDKITLVYHDEQGRAERETLRKLLASATTSHRKVVAVVVDITAEHPGNSASSIAGELAAALRERDDGMSHGVAEWLRDHGNDAEVRILLSGLLDQLANMAGEALGSQTAATSADSAPRQYLD